MFEVLEIMEYEVAIMVALVAVELVYSWAEKAAGLDLRYRVNCIAYSQVQQVLAWEMVVVGCSEAH